MKQLIFNPDKDMKELEKYGFYKCECYGKFFYIKNDMSIREDGEIGTTCYLDMLDLDIFLLDIYDLIKANLLIVENDEDE